MIQAMNPRLRLAVLIGALSLSGCFLTPAGQQVQLLEARASLLDTRVDQLEVVRASGGAAAEAASSSAVGDAALERAGTLAFESAAGSNGSAGFTNGGEGMRLPGLGFNFRKAMGKHGRGLTNLLTGWVEMPKGVHETTQQSGAMSGMTLGLLRGAGHGFIRTVAGGYEAITFPFPAPPGYRPVIRPEFIFTCDLDGGAP